MRNQEDRSRRASAQAECHYILFYEYFHGDSGRGVGASHQTGWTGLVASLIQEQGERRLQL